MNQIKNQFSTFFTFKKQETLLFRSEDTQTTAEIFNGFEIARREGKKL